MHTLDADVSANRKLYLKSNGANNMKASLRFSSSKIVVLVNSPILQKLHFPFRENTSKIEHKKLHNAHLSVVFSLSFIRK